MGKPIKILKLACEASNLDGLEKELISSGLHFTLELVQALEEYEQAIYRADIILSDYVPFSADGFSAFEIRQRISPRTPFIVVSGTIGEEKAVELIKMGMTDYVLKENMYQLVPKIQRALMEAANRKQKKTTLRQLRKREQQLGRIMDLSLDMTCIMDQRGRFVLISAACKYILGYLPQELIGKKAVDLVHPQDREKTFQAIADMGNGLDLINFENRYIRKDCREVTLLWTAHWDQQEQLGYCVARDVTESKTAGIELCTREARLKQAQAIGHMGSWEINWADKSVKWSDEMYRMLGVEQKDIIPSLEASASLVHPDDRPAFLNRFQEISVSLKNGSLGYRILRSDGQVRYVILAWRFEFDERERPVCLFGIQQDITERKLAQLALEESEAKYRHLFNSSPIPMWVYDVETLLFLDVNYAAIDHYGFSKEEFLSMTLKDIRQPEDIPRLEQLVKRLKCSGLESLDIFRHKKKSGEVIEVEIKTNLIELGVRKARLVMATDITQRNRHIKAIEELNLRLREIAWTQSHVVRAPLARLMGLTSLVNDYSLEKLNNNKILDLIQASAHELDEIIREIVRKAE